MPNRTIYIADADLPIFGKTQELTGENLSAMITQALRYFVEAEEARASGFEEVTVKVGKIAHSYKRFRGRLLAKGHVCDQSQTRHTVYEVYQPVRGNWPCISEMPLTGKPRKRGHIATCCTMIGRNGPVQNMNFAWRCMNRLKNYEGMYPRSCMKQ